jgi:hypothetical protein
MWVYLEPWIVQDGALPELARGSHLRNVGLWADCRSVGPARTAMDGIAELAGPDSAHESGRYRYELTGVAGPAQGIRTGNEEQAGSEFVITAGDLGMVARTAGPVSEVAAGSRVTAQCTLNVAADYEWDAFELPDLRADWYVRRLKIEQRQIDYVRGGPEGPVAGWPGKVLRSFEIERMSRWDDDHAGTIMARYVLDLIPLPASQDSAGLQPTIK